MVDFNFDWDEGNICHLARHSIAAAEVEQVIQNRPVDLSSEVRNCEERVAQIGETDEGRILIVVTAMNANRIRAVTAWPAKERLRRYFETQKGNGNVGRIEKDDFRE